MVQKVQKAKKARPVQAVLPFRQRGGARVGAGRKPNGAAPLMARTTRPAHAAYHPALVTVKLRQHLPRLRNRKERAALLSHFARGKDRFGFRLLHFAILNDHLHFVVEAKDRTALSRGLQGLLIRLARGLNKLWGRKGKVFAGNGRKHAAQGRMIAAFDGPDMFTSAPWFDGFVATIEVRGIDGIPLPVARARTWLANDGWRRLGKIGLEEQPKVG
jgi:REP element-mobilizing transposase RayT